MATSYYKSKYNRAFTPGKGLPVVSTDLDSVRAYQFEIHFQGLPGDIVNETDFTLAAKSVGGAMYSADKIKVSRVNDTLFYPGKPTAGDLLVKFDNLYLRETASDLWRYFKSVYDPITGEMTKNASPGGGDPTFKAEKVEIVQLDNTMVPHATLELYGVWPSKWSASEFNYETNQFHTLEVTFAYDFMQQYNYANA